MTIQVHLHVGRHRDVRARFIADLYLGFTILPYDLQLIVLDVAGLLRVGKRSMCFELYNNPFFGRLVKWQSTQRGLHSYRKRTERTKQKA